MHFIFEDHDARVLGAMDDERVAGVKADRLAIAREAGHQIGSALDLRRPAREAIAGLEDCIFSKRIKKMFPVDQPLQPSQDDLKERIQGWKNIGGLKDFVFVSLFHENDSCAARPDSLSAVYADGVIEIRDQGSEIREQWGVR